MRRRGRLWLRVLAGFTALVLIAAVAGYWWVRPLLRTGTGYAAHNACALNAIAHRAPVTADLPPNPLVPYLRIGPEGGGYRASVLGVFAGQLAWPVDGFGCTLAGSRPDFGPATPVDPTLNPLAAQPAPAADAVLDAAVASAFGDHLDAAGRTRLGTRAIVVVRDGRIVAERYASGFDARTPQLGWSMSKSVTTLLVGRLMQHGVVRTTDAGLRAEWTDDRARITVEDLLRMRSGLAWDETYDLGTPITAMLYDRPDMAAFVASRPLAHPVGTVQQYSSGSTTLLCGVLAARTGHGADLPRRELFAPLGLSTAVWETDATGTPVCSSYLWAGPRDWAAIGQFALSDGVWQGRRLLPEGWMRASTSTVPVGTRENPNYAAGWWTNAGVDGTLIDPTLPADTYWASGHDGQRLYVVPSKGLVVVRLGFSPGVNATDLGMARLITDVLAR